MITYRPKLAIFLFIFASLLAINVNAAGAEEIIDSDGDGLSDNDEAQIYHTDPQKADTDGDGHNDGDEVRSGYSPLHIERKKLNRVDTDEDGLNDALEIALGTHLANADTDNDGITDGNEVANGHNPLRGGGDKSMPRRVEVDLTRQQLNYYLGNVKIGTIPVSTGVLGRETPKGEFKIMRKVHHVTYAGPGYYYPNTKWNMEFKRSFYLHGAYWHNQFGKRPMSHGCVNIAYKDVEKLYAFLDVGDVVKITGKTPVRVAVGN